MSGTIHVVLPWAAVGGLEKRLVGLFLHLADRGEDIRLVAARRLVETLSASEEGAGLRSRAAQLDLFDAADDDPTGPLRALLGRLFRRAPDGVFHYGLASPLRLHLSRSRRTLYTIPNATLAQYNARGLVEVYGGVLRATRVDVLDPEVFRTLARRFPWRRGSFSLTPGSFVDLDVYRPKAGADKENLIVFVGLFSEEKQAPRLVRELPALLDRLGDGGAPPSEIVLLGRDAPGSNVSAAVRALASPRVSAWSEPDPKTVLARAKVFLSLQRTTNHPSKSLLEAMACGAAPVVTDTRDSRLSAPDRFARYVPRDFTARDLAAACRPLLARTPEEIDTSTDAMRAFLADRFSLATMASYYRLLYDQLRALPF